MEYEMIPDTLPHPTRSSITKFRTILRVTILAVGCTLPTISFLFAAELFPFAPPSSSQQRSVEQQSVAKPQLTQEDLDRISQIASQATQLSQADQVKFKATIQKNLSDAIAKGNLAQAKYYRELLQRIE
jgi:hypothetical protein